VVRPRVRAWNPLLVTIRVRGDVPDLRQPHAWVAIVRTMRRFRGRRALRFVHYSVLFDHMHFIAESEGRESLSRGMQAFTSRLARALNRCFSRRGSVLAGRYHARELCTPAEVRNALRYVLLNARHHAAQAGVVLPPEWLDPRSTAAIFDGWREPPRVRKRFADFGTSPARSWLLRVGWRKHGALELAETPGLPKPAESPRARAA